jgi:hypothetical protein
MTWSSQCNTHEGDDKCVQNFYLTTSKGRDRYITMGFKNTVSTAVKFNVAKMLAWLSF